MALLAFPWNLGDAFRMATDAEKQAHGLRLRVAMASKPIDREGLAAQMKVDPKTVTNWRSGRTMPSEGDLVKLADILGNYNVGGDPVELALKQSDLHEWRQDAVLSFYKRNLHEQAAEAPAMSEPVRNLRSVAKPGGLEPEDGDLNEP